MSDLFASVLFVFFIYCAYCVAIYKPQPATVPDSEQPINYFPEVKEETDPEPQPQPKPITIVEPLPQAAFTAPNLNDLSIRQLKALAKERTGTPNAIKGYSRLTKPQLIAALS